MRLSALVLGAACFSAAVLPPAAFAVPNTIAIDTPTTAITVDTASLLGVSFAHFDWDLTEPSTGPALTGLRLGASAPLDEILCWCQCQCLADHFDVCFDYCCDCGSDTYYTEHQLQFGFGTRAHFPVNDSIRAYFDSGYSYGRTTYDFKNGYSNSSSSNNLRASVGVEIDVMKNLAVRPNFGLTESLTYHDTSWHGGVMADYRYNRNFGLNAGLIIQLHAIQYVFGLIYFFNVPHSVYNHGS